MYLLHCTWRCNILCSKHDIDMRMNEWNRHALFLSWNGRNRYLHSSLLKIWDFFHSWEKFSVFPLVPSDDPYSVNSASHITLFLRAVDITMRPSVQWLIEQNVKCHVTFFRLIKFKISIWVCNKIHWPTENERKRENNDRQKTT